MILTYEQKFEDLARSVRALRQTMDIFELELKDSESPEFIVAGIEARAIVRSGMKSAFPWLRLGE